MKPKYALLAISLLLPCTSLAATFTSFSPAGPITDINTAISIQASEDEVETVNKVSVYVSQPGDDVSANTFVHLVNTFNSRELDITGQLRDQLMRCSAILGEDPVPSDDDCFSVSRFGNGNAAAGREMLSGQWKVAYYNRTGSVNSNITIADLWEADFVEEDVDLSFTAEGDSIHEVSLDGSPDLILGDYLYCILQDEISFGCSGSADLPYTDDLVSSWFLADDEDLSVDFVIMNNAEVYDCDEGASLSACEASDDYILTEHFSPGGGGGGLGISALLSSTRDSFSGTMGFSLDSVLEWMAGVLMFYIGSGLALLSAMKWWIVVVLSISAVIFFVYKGLRFHYFVSGGK